MKRQSTLDWRDLPSSAEDKFFDNTTIEEIAQWLELIISELEKLDSREASKGYSQSLVRQKEAILLAVFNKKASTKDRKRYQDLLGRHVLLAHYHKEAPPEVQISSSLNSDWEDLFGYSSF